jgi:hypothetical protein
MRREGMEFMLFAFRWLLCLFIREFSVPNLLCLWVSVATDCTATHSHRTR